MDGVLVAVFQPMMMLMMMLLLVRPSLAFNSFTDSLTETGGPVPLTTSCGSLPRRAMRHIVLLY
jgi:hypothetical protein